MKKLIIICIILSGSMSFASMGGYDAGTLNSQYMRDLRMHEAITRAKNKDAIVKKSVQAEQQNTKLNGNTKIKSINFVNNKAIPTQNLMNLVSYRLDESLTEESVADMKNQIIRYYQSKGYYSAVVFLDMKNIMNGDLVFDINEGPKNSITVE